MTSKEMAQQLYIEYMKKLTISPLTIEKFRELYKTVAYATVTIADEFEKAWDEYPKNKG